MTSTIPIANLYYLYCYAWERFPEGKALAVNAENSPDLPNLLTRVLINGMRTLFRRGLDRAYLPREEELTTLRGHIEIGLSLRLQARKVKRLHCSYDELRRDVLHNQILKATLRRLAIAPSLASVLKSDAQSLIRRMHDVSDIRLTHSCFARVQLSRNSAYYDFLLKVARLAFDVLLPSSEPGAFKFQDITRNEREMARVFEAFVRNFCKLEQSEYTVEPLTITWDAIPVNASKGDRLPSMRVDVFLRSPRRQIIIDTKYYVNALQTYQGVSSFRSENLYQLFSYIKNHSVRVLPGTQLDGMLLYPQVGSQFDAQFSIQGNDVRLATIDLGQPWQDISERILGLISK